MTPENTRELKIKGTTNTSRGDIELPTETGSPGRDRTQVEPGPPDGRRAKAIVRIWWPWGVLGMTTLIFGHTFWKATTWPANRDSSR